MAGKNLLVSIAEDSAVISKDVEVRYKADYNFDPIDDIETFADESTVAEKSAAAAAADNDEFSEEESSSSRNRASRVNFNVVFDNEKLMPPNTRRYMNPRFMRKNRGKISDGSAVGGLTEESVEFLKNDENSDKKRAERAKRFGIHSLADTDQTAETATAVNYDDKTIFALYDSFGIDPDDIRHKEKYRLNAIFVRGVERLSTNQIFDYFDRYPPKFLEWINDTSCNVVWENKRDAAYTMLVLSKPIKISNKIPREKEDGEILELKNNTDENEEGELEKSINAGIIDDDQIMESDHEEDDQSEENDLTKNNVHQNDPEEDEGTVTVDASKYLVPPGVWRVGQKSDLSDLILFRFSTIDDVKSRNTERDSAYYRQNGNPNFGGMTGLISGSRKRRLQMNRRNGSEAGYRRDGSRKRTPRSNDYADDDDENYSLIPDSSEYYEKRERRSRFHGSAAEAEPSNRDLRSKLKNSSRWKEIKSGNRRPSDDERDEISPYSDEYSDNYDEENGGGPRKRSGKYKKLRMQMRADDVQRKMVAKPRHTAALSHRLSTDDRYDSDDDGSDNRNVNNVHVAYERSNSFNDNGRNGNSNVRYRGRGTFDMRERLKKFKMKITVKNNDEADNLDASGTESGELTDADDDDDFA